MDTHLIVEVHDKFKKNINLHEGRYCVGLTWKDNQPVLPNSYRLSVNRLKSLLSRLKRNPKILEAYNDIIIDQLKNNVIETVPESACAEVGKVHYLPHHPVIRQDKNTAKMHIVASSSVNSVSLNSWLEPGACLIPNLLEVLIRFRYHKKVEIKF